MTELENKPSLEDLQQKSWTIFCKICHSVESHEKLIQPCSCKGSMGSIHLSCLERWLNESGLDKCELCLFQFVAERIRRYTIWQSMIIWVRHPIQRSRLWSDFSVMITLTIVVVVLICGLTYGAQIFKVSEASKPIDTYSYVVLGILIALTAFAYFASMYMIIRDNVTPWYRWWRSCNVIKLNRELLQLSNSEDRAQNELVSQQPLADIACLTLQNCSHNPETIVRSIDV